MEIIITLNDGTKGFKTNVMYEDSIVYQTMSDKRIEAEKIEKLMKAINVSVKCEVR